MKGVGGLRRVPGGFPHRDAAEIGRFLDRIRPLKIGKQSPNARRIWYCNSSRFRRIQSIRSQFIQEVHP
jgi:hypothetical protein